MVTNSFVGNGKYGVASFEQTAQTVVHQPMSVIDAIWEAAKTEYPELRLHRNRMKKIGLKTFDEIIKVGDFRPFAELLHMSYPVFERRETNSGSSKVDTTHCCASYWKTNSFPSVRHSVVSETYHHALRALAIRTSFSRILVETNGQQKWRLYGQTFCETHNYTKSWLRTLGMTMWSFRPCKMLFLDSTQRYRMNSNWNINKHRKWANTMKFLPTKTTDLECIKTFKVVAHCLSLFRPKRSFATRVNKEKC